MLTHAHTHICSRTRTHIRFQYAGHDPVYVGAVGFAASAVTIFVFSFLFNNTSFFDLYWSVAPVGLIVYWPLAAYRDGQEVRVWCV